MLDTPSKLRILPGQKESADDDALPLLAALAFVGRHKTVILTCLLVALGLAGLYLIIAPNRFTATAQLLTDTKRSDSPAAQYGLVDAAVVDSQVETIKSEKIAIAVINKLHLTQDPEFSENGILGRLLAAVSFSRNDITSEQEQLRKTVEMDPGFYYAHWTLGDALELKGRNEEAIAEYKKAIALNDDPLPRALLGHLYAKIGRKSEALEILKQVRDLRESSKQRYVSPYNLALIHIGLGQKDEAIQLLEETYEERDGYNIAFLRVEPMLDPLRGDPRFEALVQKVFGQTR